MGWLTHPSRVFFTGSATAQTGTSLVTISVANRVSGDTRGPLPKVRLAEIKIERTSGSGANFTPRLFRSSVGPPAAEDISRVYVGTNTLVANLHVGTPTEAWTQTDANGDLHLQAGFNAGNDNAYDYELWFEVAL